MNIDQTRKHCIYLFVLANTYIALIIMYFQSIVKSFQF